MVARTHSVDATKWVTVRNGVTFTSADRYTPATMSSCHFLADL